MVFSLFLCDFYFLCLEDSDELKTVLSKDQQTHSESAQIQLRTQQNRRKPRVLFSQDQVNLPNVFCMIKQ